MVGVEDLYCKVCQQYFNSFHNKREHVLGRKHLQKVAKKLREETESNAEKEEEQYPGLNVPIFTEEFLTYSKGKCNANILKFGLVFSISYVKNPRK